MLIILASSSPRRAELLRKAGLDVQIHAPCAEELPPNSLPPCDLAKQNAKIKALSVSRLHPGSIVIGADTIIALGDRVFGKPASLDEAREMLRCLSGKVHEALTGVYVTLPTPLEPISFVERTLVRFHSLDAPTIERHIAKASPLDKAGAYALQDDDGSLIAEIKGCRMNVIGLPVPRLLESLRALGLGAHRSISRGLNSQT